MLNQVISESSINIRIDFVNAHLKDACLIVPIYASISSQCFQVIFSEWVLLTSLTCFKLECREVFIYDNRLSRRD